MEKGTESPSMIPADEVKVTVGCRVSATQKMKREAEAKQKGYPSLSQYLEAILSGKENICETKADASFVNLKDEDLEQIETRLSLVLEEKNVSFEKILSEMKDSLLKLGESKKVKTTDAKAPVLTLDLKKLVTALKLDDKTAKELATELNRFAPNIEKVRALLGFAAQIEPTEPIEDTDFRLVELTERNEQLETELAAIIGNEKLQSLFEQYKGQEVEYKTPDGEKRKQQIEVLSDLVTVLCETVFDNPKK